MKHSTRFICLCLLLLICFLSDIAVGSVNLPLRDVCQTIIGQSNDPIYREIILNHRLPKALTAVLTGSALSLSGVLMQTLFRNPLAGPDVLGVTSGAGLGVALLTLGTSALPFWMVSNWGQSIAAIIGAMSILLLIIAASAKIKQNVSLLIVGIMFGYLAGSLVSILQSFSNPDTLKLFITWTFGSLSSVGWEQMRIMAPLLLMGILIAFCLQKALNILLLGSHYATGLGIKVHRIRLQIILLTALLAGTSTAFTGPIAFIGITMPHMARGWFQTPNHRIILPASMLCGASTLLCCDMISQLPHIQGTLPINAVTALMGAPIILWILLKNKTY